MSEQPPVSRQGTVPSFKMMTVMVAIALVILAAVAFVAMGGRNDDPYPLGWAFAILLPAISLALSRFAAFIPLSGLSPKNLQAAFTSRFFVSLAFTEAPGLILFVLGFVFPMQPIQVALGMVLTAVVVVTTLWPTRAKVEALADRLGATEEDSREFLAQF